MTDNVIRIKAIYNVIGIKAIYRHWLRLIGQEWNPLDSGSKTSLQRIGVRDKNSWAGAETPGQGQKPLGRGSEAPPWPEGGGQGQEGCSRTLEKQKMLTN